MLLSTGLEEAIRDLKQKENILPQLMSGAPVDALFDKEIKKYDGLKADVTRNVTRNDELLGALTRDAQVSLGGAHDVNLPGSTVFYDHVKAVSLSPPAARLPREQWAWSES
jgi:hypothetical protein